MLKALYRTGWRSLRTFRERREDYKMKKQQDQFKSMVASLAEKEEFTLRDYRKQVVEHLKSQTGGFMKLLSGTSKEESEMVDIRKILNALTDSELVDYKRVDSTVRRDIAQVTQLSIQHVNKAMQSYKMELKLHAYLRARKLRNEHLPENQQELYMMMTADRPPPSFDEKANQHQKVSDQQRRMWQYRR